MVVILCPHCSEEIALEDDAYGDFSCPYCEGEFEWKPEKKKLKKAQPNSNGQDGMFSSPVKIANFVLFVAIIFVTITSFGATYYKVSSPDTSEEIAFGVTGYTETSPGYIYISRYSDEVTFTEEAYNDCVSAGGDLLQCNEIQEVIDFFKNFRNAGRVFSAILSLAVFSNSFVFLTKLFLFLDEKSIFLLPDRWYHRLQTYDLVSPIIASILLIIGNIIFIVLRPSMKLLFYEDALESLNKGYTLFPFIVILLSIALVVTSLIRVNTES